MKLFPSIVGIGAYAAFITYLYYFRVGGEEYFSSVSWAITFVTIGIALLFGYRSFRYFGSATLQGKSILYLLATIASWLTANIITFFTLKENAVSVADLFFLLGYPFFAIGISIAIRMIYPKFMNSFGSVLLWCLLIAGLFVGYLRFFPLTWNHEISQLENLITSGYVVADFVLLVFTIALLLSVFRGNLARGWMIIGIGILCTFTGDVLYTQQYQSYNLAGEMLDLLYYYAYLLYAVGFIVIRHVREKSTSYLQ